MAQNIMFTDIFMLDRLYIAQKIGLYIYIKFVAIAMHQENNSFLT